MEEYRKYVKRFLIGVVAVIVTVVGVLSVTYIPAATVGVKVTPKGIHQTTLGTGFHLKTPFLDRIYKLPTSVQFLTLNSVTLQTKDRTDLQSILDIQYRIDPKNAMKVFDAYKTVDVVSERTVPPAVQEVADKITSKYTVAEIFGEQRSVVTEKIEEALQAEFAKYNLELVQFSLTDTDAGETVEKALKESSAKQHEAFASIEKAKHDQERAKVEAETKLLEAQAEADAELVRAETQAKANQIIAGSLTPEIIAKMEAEARMEHGWVTHQGVSTQVTTP